MKTRIMGLVLVLLPASAAAVPLSLRVQEPQFRRLERALEGTRWDFAQDRVEQEGYLCFDPVGVEGLSLTAAVDEVTLVPGDDGRLRATVLLGSVEVRGTMFAEGSFVCPDVREPLDPLLLEGVEITLSLGLQTGDGGTASLRVLGSDATVGAVTISGSDTLAWLEDEFGLVESYLPDLVDYAAREAVAYANEQIASYRAGSLFGVPYDVVFTHAQVGAAGLSLSGDVLPAAGDKAACLPAGAAQPVFTAPGAPAPSLDTTLAPASGVIVSAGPTLPQELLAAAWWAGAFCGETAAQPPALLADTLAQITGRPSGELRIRWSLGAAPAVTITDVTTQVVLHGVHLEVEDPSGTLLAADFDLAASGRARVGMQTHLLLGTIDEMSLAISAFESALVPDEEGRLEMIRFLENELPVQLVAGVKDLPVADGVFLGDGGRTVLELLRGDGGLRAALSPWLDSDPEVDTVPPETTIALTGGEEAAVVASDDRDGALVWSWSVDGGPWSAWTGDPRVPLPREPGRHEVQAISRDRWGNVDPTPAVAHHDVDGSETVGACACSTAGSGRPPAGAASLALALAAGIVLLRRRAAPALLAGAAAVVAFPVAARADDTRVLPPGVFIVSATGAKVLHNPPADVSGSRTEIPTGMFPLGIDARARTESRMQATLVVPSVVVGVYRNVNVMAYLPVFLDAEVQVREFEVRAAGVDVTPQAQDALRRAGFRGPGGGEEPVSTWRGKGVGDLTVLGRWRVHGNREWAALVSGGAKLPTGRRDDPRILTDFGFGDGQVDVPVDLLAERRFEPFAGGVSGGYRLRLPGTMRVRPVGGPTITTTRDPGDVVRGAMWARSSGAGMRAIGFDATLAVEHHFRDHDAAGLNLPDMRGTALVMTGGIGVNNVKWFLRHRLGLPLMLNVGMQRSIALTGNSRLETWQATARVDFPLAARLR